MKYLDLFLKVKKQDRNILQIILWWEIRRIFYNIIILVAGLLSITILILAAKGRVKLEPGEDLFEPFMIPLFGFLCNLGYTLGWLTEVFKNRSSTYGPKMFKRGLYFTLFWVFLLPSIWVIFAIIDETKKLF